MTSEEPASFEIRSMITLPPHEYRYERFYITRFFFAFFLIGLILIAWVPVLYLQVTLGFLYGPILRAAVSLSVSYLLLVLLARFGNRELGKVRYLATPKGIGRRDPRRILFIPWADITRVRYHRFPLMKGFLTVSSRRGKLFLPSTLVGFGEIGEIIAAGLASADKAKLCDESMLRSVHAMGTMSERWNIRARNWFWPFVTATVGSVIVFAFVAARMWNLEPFPFLIWTALGILPPILIYSLADIRQNHAVERRLQEGKKGPGERAFVRELWFSFLVVSLAFGLLGIFFKAIFIR